MRLSYAPYRLRFKRPLALAHGTRDGTDALFLRIEHQGRTGYGEVTLPPYLGIAPKAVLKELQGLVEEGVESLLLKSLSTSHGSDPVGISAPLRAGLNMAFNDLMAKRKGVSMNHWIDAAEKPQGGQTPVNVFTLTSSDLNDMSGTLSKIPEGIGLKLKVGSADNVPLVEAVAAAYDGPVLLDGNQGCPSVDHVLKLVGILGEQRVLGIEQPFAPGGVDLHADLASRTRVAVIADEAVRGPKDLEAAAKVYGGVNIKLIKCGGLDRAGWMIRRARELGMQVMLGCMSESSLGCAAIACLGPGADILDLDGPWLLANDPFAGIRWEQGAMVIQDAPGIGVDLIAQLDWIPIGA